VVGIEFAIKLFMEFASNYDFPQKGYKRGYVENLKKDLTTGKGSLIL
jgi:hypothetical protein